ncbi:MAG: hypothetical protein Q8R28_14410, partial [Dehalococcoidia bacterium]|nr:hypothetical protein [Dehalococcoidia bacterium]
MAGLTSKDFSSQATAASLRRNGFPGKDPDPVDDALALQRKLLGARIIEQTVAERDTDAIKAENERLKALAEQQTLRQANNPAGAVDP